MKIALSFPACHRRGGVERVLLEAANFLGERGHETHLFVAEYDENLLHSRVTPHQVAADTRSSIRRVRSFRDASWQAIGQLQPPAEAIGSFGVFAPPEGVVWMQSVHRSWIEISRAQRGFKGRLLQRLNPFHSLILRLENEQLRNRRYRHVVALTEEVKQDVIRFYDVPASDITVVHNGFAPAEFSIARRENERESMRQKLGFKHDDQVIVFVANELERKGFYPLLQAISQLNNPRLHLLAVGRLNAASCSAQINAAKLEGRVHFTGPSSDVAAYYAAADVFALPTYYEAWGLVIVEAMACGLPALTSRLAGASVAVSEGRNGALLDNPHNAEEIAIKLQSLLAGCHEPHAEIAASVASYSWPNLLPRYEAVLHQYSVD